MPQNGDLRRKNDSKMAKKQPKFAFFSAEMTGTHIKWVKVVDPQLDTTISCKKSKFPPKKIHFKAVFGQKWEKLRKNGGNSQLCAYFTEK